MSCEGPKYVAVLQSLTVKIGASNLDVCAIRVPVQVRSRCSGQSLPRTPRCLVSLSQRMARLLRAATTPCLCSGTLLRFAGWVPASSSQCYTLYGAVISSCMRQKRWQDQNLRSHGCSSLALKCKNSIPTGYSILTWFYAAYFSASTHPSPLRSTHSVDWR